MIANDCLRRIRYILDLDDAGMIGMFAEADQSVTRAQVSNWLKRDEDPAYEECPDVMFATFLNGLINNLRGKREGEQPKPEERLTNNIIFRKLKIAFNLQADEILSILALAGLGISKHELSAFFRKTDNRHHRVCNDQVLRNFLKGLQIKFREEVSPDEDDADADADADADENIKGDAEPFRWKQNSSDEAGD